MFGDFEVNEMESRGQMGYFLEDVGELYVQVEQRIRGNEKVNG